VPKGVYRFHHTSSSWTTTNRRQKCMGQGSLTPLLASICWVCACKRKLKISQRLVKLWFMKLDLWPKSITHVKRFPVTSLTGKSLTGKLPTCWQQVVVMEFGKRHDATDTTDFCPAPTCYRLSADLFWICCNGEVANVADLLRETGVMDFGLYHPSWHTNVYNVCDTEDEIYLETNCWLNSSVWKQWRLSAN